MTSSSTSLWVMPGFNFTINKRFQIALYKYRLISSAISDYLHNAILTISIHQTRSINFNNIHNNTIIMSSNDNTSSLQSMMDTATGYINSGIAAVTGSTGDQAKADEYKTKGQAESDLSHAAAKAGPFTISSSGAPAKDNSDRTQGQWDQTMGSAKETVGNLIGSADLKQQGREQNLQGQGQEAKGQLNDLGKGVSDRVQGAVGGAAAALTGDRTEQQRYADIHDEGKTRQRGVELDMDKQAAAHK
jgi:uncharacterized protein YjbJ (UPF0337 family)